VPTAPVDQPFFIPAETTAEAISRIYSLTGASNPGTRGEKRALVALRDALGLDIDLARTNVETARALSLRLDIQWRPIEFEIRNTVNLDGLNALLEGATEEYHRGSLRRMEEQRPEGLTGPEWGGFKPARSKIEAVNRISALTNSGPEDLGPGSKERKRVLENLARNLEPQVDTSLTKTKLGAVLAARLGAPWSDLCESTGETISLIGLNTLLAGAERRLGRLGTSSAETLGTPEAEGGALAAALVDKLDRHTWDGQKTVVRMQRDGIPGCNQSEWQGFYFEGRGRQILNALFPPLATPLRARYNNTPFDYSLNFVWDLKCHTERWINPVTGALSRGRPTVQLNDERAIRECVEDQGLGFLMLSGQAVEDVDQDFAIWHAGFKGKDGPQRRRVKAGFTPLHVEAFWIQDTPSLLTAIAAGALKVAPQGSQPDGSPRNPKFDMRPEYARGRLDVSRAFFW
jgi:hypothetical protein